MNHRRRLLSIALLVALLATARAVDAPATFYVSPAGNDAWSGTKAEAGGGDGPFASLAKARDAVRARRQAATGPIVVQLRGGRHQLSAPLVFGPEDSGSAAAPVVWMAYPGETPVLSGGRVIEGWKVGSDGRWTTTIAGVGADWYPRQLVVDGERRFRPRLPKSGWHVIAGWAGADPGAKYDTPADAFEYQAGDLDAGWRNLTDIDVTVMHFWVDTHLPIASIEAGPRVVRFARKSRRKLTDDYTGRGARYYVDNVAEALSEPGEWYLDRPSGVITYLPRAGEDPSRAQAVVPVIGSLLEIAGAADGSRAVEHLEFRGLTFSDTHWELPAQDAGDLQAADSVPGAVLANGARHIAFSGCRFLNLGSYGIGLGRGVFDCRIQHCEFAHLAAGGIKLDGGDARSPEAQRNGRHAITDNHLHDLGQLYHSAVGVLLQHSFGNTIAHNRIHHLYYTGISVGWVWGYGPSVSRDNRIEANHIHHVGQKLLSDMGGIYLLGVSPGTVVRGNLIHDVDSWGYGGWGIYTDEGSSGIVIEDNLVHRTKSGGFHQHYGRDNLVRNNIFALAREEQVARSREEPHSSFVFERNIVYWTEGPLLGKNWDDGHFTIDRNCYWNPDGKPVRFAKWSLEEWRQRGHDRASLIADPRFADPAKGDFTLPADSPAIGLGFTPFDLSRVGPRPAGAGRGPAGAGR